MVCFFFYQMVVIVALVEKVETVITFLREPDSTVAKYGSKLSLHCSATTTLSNGVISVFWKHNNSWIKDYKSKNYRIHLNGSLSFLQLLPHNQGTYQCSVIVFIDNSKKEQKFSKTATLQLPFIDDRFSYISNPFEVSLGTTIHLQCVSPSCIPLCNIVWKHNDIPLHNYQNGTQIIDNHRTSSTLQISNFSLNNVGSYNCISSNPMLPENQVVRSKSIPVIVKSEKSAPYFYLKPKALVATRFMKDILNCIILGNPQPKISWFKDELVLLNTSEHSILINGSLAFHQIKLKDSGKYYCTGENSHGSVTSNPPVSVNVTYIGFVFQVSPISGIVLLGNSFILHCQPPDSYPVNVQLMWYLNYTQIAENESVRIFKNNSLFVKRANVDDAGFYFCQAVNRLSMVARASKIAEIKVYILPSLHLTSTNFSVTSNHDLHIQCNPEGVPYPNTTVYKTYNGKKFIVSNNGTLYIPSVNHTHQGTYLCLAKNQVGEVKETFFINVLLQPVILTRLRNVTTVDNVKVEKTKFKCDTDGNPEPVVYWSFHSNEREKNITDGNDLLEITSLKINEGFYTCTAFNPVGIARAMFYFQVLLKPKILSMDDVIIVNQSSSFTISCNAVGDPRVTIQWFYLNQQVNNSSKYQLKTVYGGNNGGMYNGNSLLSVQDVIAEDAGLYVCKVNNTVGESYNASKVIVQVPPSEPLLSITSSFVYNTSLLVTCSIYGNPSPQIFLTHNNTTLVSHGNSTQGYNTTKFIKMFPQINITHSGNYSCCGRNFLGTSCTTKNSIVKVLPYSPHIIQVSPISAYSINITWESSFNGNSPVYLYGIYVNTSLTTFMTSTISTVYSYVIRNLHPYTLYIIKMFAKNGVGESFHTMLHAVTTLEAAPSAPPHLTLLNKTSTSVTLLYQQPLIQNGRIKLYQICYGEVAEGKAKSLKVVNITVLVPVLTEMRTVKYLLPFTKYIFKVRTATITKTMLYHYGPYSNKISVLTKEDKPSLLLTNITITNATSNSCIITIEPPSASANGINGLLKGYVIKYTSTVNGSDTVIQTNSTVYVFNGLVAYSRYEIVVAVYNKAGIGPYSQPVVVITKQGVPGVINNATVTQINETSVLCHWNAPVVKNGNIIGYLLYLSTFNSTILKKYTSYASELFVHDLVINTTYGVSIAAQTIVGYGNFTDQSYFTLASVYPSSTPDTKVVAANKSSWLEREYLTVIISISSFAAVLLIVVLILAVARCCYHCTKPKEVLNEWQLNPYYGHNESCEGDTRTGKLGDLTDSTLHNCDMVNDDLIWDEDSTYENLIFSCHTEVKYETAKPVTPPVVPSKFSYASVDQPTTASSEGYVSVEPYQGRKVEMSPLVRLNGKPKRRNNSMPDVIFMQKDFEGDKNGKSHVDNASVSYEQTNNKLFNGFHSLDHQPSFTNLNDFANNQSYDNLSAASSLNSDGNDSMELNNAYLTNLDEFNTINYNHVQM